MLTRETIEGRLEVLKVAGGPMEGFWAWEALDTAQQLGEWLGNLTEICGGCPATCSAAGGRCKGPAVRAWLELRT